MDEMERQRQKKFLQMAISNPRDMKFSKVGVRAQQESR